MELLLDPEPGEVPLPGRRRLQRAGRTVGQGDVGKPVLSDAQDIDPNISDD